MEEKLISLTSSGRKFQILAPCVLRLIFPNVVVFALLTTKLFFLPAEYKPSINFQRFAVQINWLVWGQHWQHFYMRATLAFNGLIRPCHFKIFKGCLPQISFGPFLNTLNNMCINFRFKYFKILKTSISNFHLNDRPFCT